MGLVPTVSVRETMDKWVTNMDVKVIIVVFWEVLNLIWDIVEGWMRGLVELESSPHGCKSLKIDHEMGRHHRVPMPSHKLLEAQSIHERRV